MKLQRKKEKTGLISAGIFFMFFMLLSGGNAAQAANLQDTTQQDTLQEEAPNVYLDCHFYCDEDHIKREIDYVNYVRDRNDADVHIMITSERSGNEGRRYSLFMMGQNGYIHLQDTLRFNVGPDASEEQSRQRLLHALKSGLTPYLIKTPLWQNLDINYTKPTASEEVEDKWNYWIFEISADGRLSGEESQKGYDFGGRIEANKVTEDIKLEFDVDADYERDIYEVNGETITSIATTVIKKNIMSCFTINTIHRHMKTFNICLMFNIWKTFIQKITNNLMYLTVTKTHVFSISIVIRHHRIIRT